MSARPCLRRTGPALLRVRELRAADSRYPHDPGARTTTHLTRKEMNRASMVRRGRRFESVRGLSYSACSAIAFVLRADADRLFRRPRSVHRRPRVELERVQRVQARSRVRSSRRQSMLSTGLRRLHDRPWPPSRTAFGRATRLPSCHAITRASSETLYLGGARVLHQSLVL